MLIVATRRTFQRACTHYSNRQRSDRPTPRGRQGEQCSFTRPLALDSCQTGAYDLDGKHQLADERRHTALDDTSRAAYRAGVSSEHHLHAWYAMQYFCTEMEASSEWRVGESMVDASCHANASREFDARLVFGLGADVCSDSDHSGQGNSFTTSL